jgi:hypothetical protein
MRDHNKVDRAQVNTEGVGVGGKRRRVVSGVEKDPTPLDLDECGESPVLDQAGSVPERVVEDRDLVGRAVPTLQSLT